MASSNKSETISLLRLGGLALLELELALLELDVSRPSML
jgi:hypothetical protein